MTATGNPVSHDYIREMAQEIQNNRTECLEGTDGLVQYNPPIGKLWPQRFLHRHPDLATAISRTIESSRLKETSHEVIEDWFNVSRKPSRNIKSVLRICTTWMKPDFQSEILKEHMLLSIKLYKRN